MSDPDTKCASCGYPRECHEPDWHADDCPVGLGCSCECCVTYVCEAFQEPKTISVPGLFADPVVTEVKWKVKF